MLFPPWVKKTNCPPPPPSVETDTKVYSISIINEKDIPSVECLIQFLLALGKALEHNRRFCMSANNTLEI